jgi:hypothetical protein
MPIVSTQFPWRFKVKVRRLHLVVDYTVPNQASSLRLTMTLSFTTMDENGVACENFRCLSLVGMSSCKTNSGAFSSTAMSYGVLSEASARDKSAPAATSI